MRSRRPRLAWATGVLAEGAISQVALMVVVFMPPALFLAVGLVELAASASGRWTSPVRIDVDVSVGVLWVLMRCVLMRQSHLSRRSPDCCSSPARNRLDGSRWRHWVFR